MEETNVPPLAGKEWVDRAQQISAAFATTPGLDASEVWLAEARGVA